MCPEHSSRSCDPISDRVLLPRSSMKEQGGRRASGETEPVDTGLDLSTDDGVHVVWTLGY